jgi:hypothetical protein
MEVGGEGLVRRAAQASGGGRFIAGVAARVSRYGLLGQRMDDMHRRFVGGGGAATKKIKVQRPNTIFGYEIGKIDHISGMFGLSHDTRTN